MFGMLSGDPFQAFVRKPTNPFKPPFNKQSCIYSYFQNVLFANIKDKTEHLKVKNNNFYVNFTDILLF